MEKNSSKEEYIYYMFFRFLKERGLYHEFFAYCEIENNSKEEILNYFQKLISDSSGIDYAETIISNGFTWINCEKHFKSGISWASANVYWRCLVDFIYYGKDSSNTKQLKRIYGI